MTFPLMDRTRRLTEEALGEAELDLAAASTACSWSAARRGCRWSARTSREMAGKPPRTGVNVDEVVALGAAIQAAIEVGEPIGDALPRFTLSAGGPRPRPPSRAGRPPGDRRDVAQPGDVARQPRRIEPTSTTS